MHEIKWLEKQLKFISQEEKIALKKNTNNAQQSLLIYQIWKTQLIIRERELRNKAIIDKALSIAKYNKD